MSQATVTIQTSRELVAFSQALIAQRHEFLDSQAAALAEINAQIAEGARLERSRGQVIYLFESVKSNPMRNTLIRRAHEKAGDRFAAAPADVTAWGQL